MSAEIKTLREATRGSEYEGRLYVVGGTIRDRLLGEEASSLQVSIPGGIEMAEDIDIVLEGDAAVLASFLFERGVAKHAPVTYPRFGTAMVSVGERQVEIVGARKESYDGASRKPSTEPATLLDDVLRRDFTINTLLENLHTGEILDLTGRARQDIQDKIIRTPTKPEATFNDDPLRMLRAVRFAARLGFSIHPDTYAALRKLAPRLDIISGERIRDEFVKILMSENVASGLEMLRETGLLDQFAPELSAMHKVPQNVYHVYDLWTHTLKTIELISAESGMILRQAALLHDVGKVETRTVEESGDVHFYRHQFVGAEIARRIMGRLRFANAESSKVVFLVSMHMRPGEYDEKWSDAAVRRLIREAGDSLEPLIELASADRRATDPKADSSSLPALRGHIERIRRELAGQRMASPLSGAEIMELLDIRSGPEIGAAKAFLEEKIVEGALQPGDKARAGELLLREFRAGSG